MKIYKKMKEKILAIANEPFIEDRIKMISSLIRTAYNEGIIDTYRKEQSIQREVSGIKDTLIGALLEGQTLELKPTPAQQDSVISSEEK